MGDIIEYARKDDIAKSSFFEVCYDNKTFSYYLKGLKNSYNFDDRFKVVRVVANGRQKSLMEVIKNGI